MPVMPKSGAESYPPDYHRFLHGSQSLSCVVFTAVGVISEPSPAQQQRESSVGALFCVFLIFVEYPFRKEFFYRQKQRKERSPPLTVFSDEKTYSCHVFLAPSPSTLISSPASWLPPQSTVISNEKPYACHAKIGRRIVPT